MKQAIITPSSFHLPTINEYVILFFNLQYLYQFKELIGDGKIKPFGPSRYFNFTSQGIKITAIGGLIGAPLAVLTVENAIQKGGRRFLSFGSAGWLADKPEEIGQVLMPRRGIDTTGISADYENEQTTMSFENYQKIKSCNAVVSVNSVYRLTPEKVIDFRSKKIDLIDMESAPLNQVILQLDGIYYPVFVISDRIEKDFTWSNGFANPLLQESIKTTLPILPDLLIGR
jgi:hypothetical protein